MTQDSPFDGPAPPHNDNSGPDGVGPDGVGPDGVRPELAGLENVGRQQHAPEAVRSLRQAMRRARADDAERVGVQADLRATQIARLELLQEALAPLLAQIPRDVDLFDVGLMPGITPRLFIDMIGFVEMGRDARLYRLFQDTRHARVALAESTDVPTMVQAITDYVARRLLERDKALATEIRVGEVPSDPAGSAGRPVATPAAPRPKARRRRPRLLSWAGILFAFVIDLLGAIAFFLILAVAAWFLYNRLHGQV